MNRLPKEIRTVTRTSKILALLCFITLPIISFMFGMNYQYDIDTQLNQHFIDIKRVPTPTPNPTANWKTYTNIKGSYIIKYPPNLIIFEELEKELSLQVISETYFNNNKAPRKGAYLIWISVFSNPKGQTPIEYWTESFKYDQHTGDPTNYNEKERLRLAQKFINSSETVLVGEDKIEGFKYVFPDILPITQVTWFNKNKIYKLNYSLADISSGLTADQKEKMAEQILSTFKFME